MRKLSLALLLAGQVHAQEPEPVDASTTINRAVRYGIPASTLSNRWDSPLLLLAPPLPHHVYFRSGGSRFTGEHVAGGSANLGSRLVRGDDITFSGRLSEEGARTLRLSYLVPVGDYDTHVGLRYFDSEYRTHKERAILGEHGKSRGMALQLVQPVLKGADAGLFVRLMHEDFKSRDRIDAFGLVTDTRVQKVTLGADGFLRDALLGGGLTGYSFAVSEGSASIGPDGALLADQAGLRRHGPFAVQRFSVSRLQRLNNAFGVSLQFYGQRASKNLVTDERLVLGGAISAYPPGEVLGDRGHVARAALQYVLPHGAPRGGSMTLSGFYEEGKVQVRKDAPGSPQNHRSLAAYGLSFSAGARLDYSISLSLAWRADHEAALFADGAERRPRAILQLVKWF